DDEAARFEHLPFGHQRPGADDALRADHRSVQNPCTHADQGLILDGAAMKDRLMADGYPGTERQRRPGIAVADCSVLEIGLVAEDDRGVVGPDHGPEPDTAAVS